MLLLPMLASCTPSTKSSTQHEKIIPDYFSFSYSKQVSGDVLEGIASLRFDNGTLKVYGYGNKTGQGSKEITYRKEDWYKLKRVLDKVRFWEWKQDYTKQGTQPHGGQVQWGFNVCYKSIKGHDCKLERGKMSYGVGKNKQSLALPKGFHEVIRAMEKLTKTKLW